MEGPPGTLWIVATPIGTVGDLSPRAREVLAEVDILLAEDTRRTAGLLNRLGIAARGRVRSLHEHNEARSVDEILEHLRAGEDVALVSDAGTPVLSDPGFLLVRAARQCGLPVASVPGPSAFTTALAASGLPPLPATLVGFLPPKQGARRQKLVEMARAPGTLVVFVSPHRLDRELDDAAEILGSERPATLLAEMSKRFERAQFGRLGELAGERREERPKGEFVLVVGPRERADPPDGKVTEAEAREAFQAQLDAGLERSEALRATARMLGRSRRELYALLFEKKAP